jgi:hypothetical protein
MQLHSYAGDRAKKALDHTQILINEYWQLLVATGQGVRIAWLREHHSIVLAVKKNTLFRFRSNDFEHTSATMRSTSPCTSIKSVIDRCLNAVIAALLSHRHVLLRVKHQPGPLPGPTTFIMKTTKRTVHNDLTHERISKASHVACASLCLSR